MKKDEITKAFEKVKPTEVSQTEMLSSIKANNNAAKFTFKGKRYVLVFLMMLLVGVGIFNGFPYVMDKEELASQGSDNENDTVLLEDAVHQLRDEFQLADRHYHVLENPAKYGLPSMMNEADIGQYLTTITTSIDENLLGKEVYYYQPADSEAVVAVKTDLGFKRYAFYNFESYLNNQDEDASVYLALYGIDVATDIERVTFLNYKDNSHLEIVQELTDENSISRFYNYYAALENASDDYFNQLASWGTGQTDSEIIAEEEGKSTPAFEGTAGDALENMITIRIYHTSGVYYETQYYPNIGFISRYKVDGGFEGFLKE